MDGTEISGIQEREDKQDELIIERIVKRCNERPLLRQKSSIM